MKKEMVSLVFMIVSTCLSAQLSPAITSWLLNTTGTTGRHYVNGNSTPIVDGDLANVQKIQYSANFVYVTATGVPAYITGPFLDGNPSVTTNQNSIFKIPLNPIQDTNPPSMTTMGNIGVFINGVALFDSRDGVSYKFSTGTMAGGPLGGMGDMKWNRDAVIAERAGFDCAKGHPAMGNYHHHQNPSAFDLDLSVVSNVCDLYLADGLYAIDSTIHSPLIGFAYDGYPIYGAYGYKNADGTGGITRMKSSFLLRNITQRTVYANGTDVTDGPAVNTTYPLGFFKEDYGFIAPLPAHQDSLDMHNGRFCVTPEYPAGTYCYFATVDENWNAAYPYVVGPTFYGAPAVEKVSTISESVTNYLSTAENSLKNASITVYPNPASDVVMVQVNTLLKEDAHVVLYDLSGKILQEATLFQGSTIAYLDTRTLYNGEYIVLITSSTNQITNKVIISK